MQSSFKRPHFALLATLAVTTMLHAPRVHAQEILWDTYGVPHIYGDDLHAVARGFGWAQARSHGDLLLRLYGQARGRAAEYWGEQFIESDQWVRVNDIPGRARAWLAQATPEERTLLDGFVSGINAYGEHHADTFDDAMMQVLPVRPEDVLAHAQRIVHFTFVASPQEVGGAARSLGEAHGSNTWAVAPSRSESGNALLLMNPHLPWIDLFTWYEAQVIGGGIDAYGVSLLGMPMLNMAFNDRLGWAFTVNTYDGADLYALALDGDGYRWDGGVRVFDVRPDTLRVRQPDGTIATRSFDVASSVHGPVVARSGEQALALRVAGLDRPHMIGQMLDMLRATRLDEFNDALAMLQLPMFTVMYADADGHIMSVFNGVVPRRPRGDFARWSGVLPGDSSAWLWTGALAFDELPRVVDPPTGWLQNANEPPWTTTLPMALDPAAFPAYLAPPPSLPFRPQSSIRLVTSDSTMTLDEMIGLKHSTRLELAARIIDDIVSIAATADDADVRAAVDVLTAWDLATDASSRGAVLFEEFWSRYVEGTSGSRLAVPWTVSQPLSTPDAFADPAAVLAALAAAAAATREQYGALDVAWGDVHRLRAPGVDLPANGASGGLGAFRVTMFDENHDGTRTAGFGDSFVAAIEFGSPVRARALLGYGNASEPVVRSENQLELYARKQLRPVWLTRQDVEQNSKEREAVPRND